MSFNGQLYHKGGVVGHPSGVGSESRGYKMIAVNTVGNHAPNTPFEVETKAEYERFIRLGVAKKAPEGG